MKLYNNDAYRQEFMNSVYALLSSDPTNDRANQIIDLFDSAPEVEATVDTSNDPITLDDLREMDGEPVWISLIQLGIIYCAIVKDATDCGVWLCTVKDPDDYGAFALYGKTWLAYRHKPEETP